MKPKYWTIILLATVATCVSALYYTRQSPEVLPIIVKYKSKSPTIATSTPTQNDLETWKTYRNSQYGFEFKYPDFLILSSPNSPIQKFDLRVSYISPEQVSMQELTFCEAYPNKPQCGENYLVAGKQVKIVWTASDGSPTAFVSIPDSLYGQVVISFNNNTDKKELFKQILSSFKFTK